MIKENQTTQKIKDTLGVNFTVAEVRQLLAKYEAQSAKQAPYFDGRLLDRIERLKSCLTD